MYSNPLFEDSHPCSKEAVWTTQKADDVGQERTFTLHEMSLKKDIDSLPHDIKCKMAFYLAQSQQVAMKNDTFYMSSHGSPYRSMDFL